MKRRLVLVLTIGVLLAIAVAKQPRNNAPKASACDGLAEYQTSIFAAGETFNTNMESSIPGFKSRSMEELTTDDFAAGAGHFTTFQHSLLAITPPAWAAPWHQAQIDLMGASEGLYRSLATGDTGTAQVYVATGNAAVKVASAHAISGAQTCDDFNALVTDWNDLANQ